MTAARKHLRAADAPSNGRPPGREARRPGAAAFTLIELMIVVAIITVIVTMVVVPAVGARVRGNETGAIAALRTFSTQQENFRSQAVVDQDGNGVGEFGLLGELTGLVVPRRVGAVRPLAPRLLDTSFKPDANGFATRHGFYFQIYLPIDGDGNAGSDADLGGDADAPGPILGNADGITRQQYFWCAYAWPAGRYSGERTFFVDHSGVLYQTHGEALKYEGTARLPAVEAAYTGEAFASQPSAGGTIGNDGNRWTVVQ